MKRLPVLLFTLFFGLAGVAAAEAAAETVSVTLDEAVFLALRNNRDVLLKTQDLKKAKAKINEARAAFFPTLTFTGTLSRAMELYSKDMSTTTTQTSLKQYLYRGGKTLNTLAYNQYAADISTALLEKTKQDLVLSVKTAFYALLLSREYVSLNRQIVTNAEEHFRYVRERYAKGLASASELIAMKASLANVRQVYLISLNDKEALAAQLKNLLYLDQSVALEPRGRLAYALKDLMYDVALLKAVKDRPEIHQYEAQIKASRRAVDIAKADSRPSIYASWDYYSRSASAAGKRGWEDYHTAGLVFSWPIFDGWATKSKVEQAIADLRSAEILKDKTVQGVALDLKTAYLAYQDALEEIKSAGSQLDVYADQLSVAQKKFKNGHVSTLDLNDAMLKYEISVFNRTQAVYDYLIARSQFDKATGETYEKPSIV